MRFVKYGITLRRIVEDDIELIRQWRNSKPIQQNMHFREHISKSMQLKWFRSIDNINNFYYIIEYKGNKVGLFNEKNIDWENRTSETGLFIADEKLINTPIPVLASLCLSEIGFKIVQGEKSFIHILKDNHKAIEYSLSFGYVLCEGQENKELQLYVLTKENFEKKGNRLLNAANKAHKNNSTLYLFLEKHDYQTGIAQFLEQLIERSPATIPFVLTPEGRMYHYP